MPLRGEGHSDLVKDEAPYFSSLAELDAWFARPHDKLLGVVPYQPRPHVDGQSDSRGKLLVCHDYKGGYVESPSGLCYSFNFWSLCDTFVYFSHSRVAVPPSGWTNAAHKRGTRILGTLIFEGDDTQDPLQIVTGRADCVIIDKKIPMSKHYAILLAGLAHQRGFDGYLLNFESDLLYETDHALALAAWILLLRAELRDKIGPHAEVVWYDSVAYHGRVSYQNRLNAYNLPFFLASDALFTNYWWDPGTQNSMVQYVVNLNNANPDPNSSTDTTSLVASKALQDIYTGVDVWGRGLYGDGGYCCYRALTYTSPLGISTAFFAPAWTWENATENPEENWNTWWNNERELWLGPLKPGDEIPVPDSPEGYFKPMTAFFQDLPAPDPSGFAFYTHFSPGVGYRWFVEGKKVLDTKKGWSDIDKQCSLGNLVWPWPTPSWEASDQDEAAPIASTAFDMTDGYNGGNTLKLTVDFSGGKSDSEGTVKVIWLPVQSLTVSTRVSFKARVVYQTAAHGHVGPKPYIYVKPLSNEEDESRDSILRDPIVESDLLHGWSSQSVNFTSTSTKKTVSVAIGFLVHMNYEERSPSLTFSLSLSELAVYPAQPSPSVSVGRPSVTGAKFASTPYALNTLEGVLTWDTTSTFNPMNIEEQDAESTTPVWVLQDTRAYRFPTFVYFNIYVTPLDDCEEADPTDAVFIGTTGLDGRGNRFYVDPMCLPSGWGKWVAVRFYVQGVTDHGEVLPWERCASVDHRKSTIETQGASDDRTT